MTKAPSKIRQNSPFKTSCFLGRTCKIQHLQRCWKCTRRLGCGQPWTTPRIGCQILCRTGLLTLIYQSLYPRWSRWSPRITYIGCPSCSKSGSDTHLPTGSADTWPAYPERVAKTKPFNMLQLECQKSACFSPRLIMLGTLNGCIPSQTQHQCNPQTSTNCMNPGWRPLRGRRATPGPNGSATCCRTQIWDRRGVAGCHGMISDSARGCKGWNLKTSLDSMLGKNYMEKRKNYEKAEIERWSPHFWQNLDELLAVRCQVTSQFSHTFNNTNLSAWAWGSRYFQLQRWCFEASARGEGGERSPGKHVDDHWVKLAW